jgi:RimJ/RimL family protein N-acetyltransferase
MPWAAAEPTSVDEKIELLRHFRGSFDRGEDFVFGIFEPDESRVLGGSGLHTRHGPEALEVGYWVRVDAEGKGLASETTAALTRVAFEHCGVDRVEVRVDPANVRSQRVPERLGFEREARLRRRLPSKDAGGELRDVVVFAMFASDFRSTPGASVDYRAFDAAGRPL